MQALSAMFGGPPPEAVTDLYACANGSSDAPVHEEQHAPCRLMPVSEVQEVYAELSAIDAVMLCNPIWLFTDDNSNYAGVYSDHPLRAYVTILSHDEPDPSPRWSSIAEFLSAVLTPEADGALATDLPSVHPKLPVPRGQPSTSRSEELGLRFLTLASQESDDDYRRAYMFAGARLLPPDRASMLVPFLDDGDMWIPEQAAIQLGMWEYEPAVPKLVELVLKGRPNGDTAGIIALVAMSSTVARDALKTLRLEGDDRVRRLLRIYANR